MNRKLLYLAMGAGLLGLASCKESTSAPALFNTATVTADVALSAGDAAATTVETMTGNEVTAAMPSPPARAFDLLGSASNTLSIIRNRTCFDSTGAVVAACSPIASVRKVVTHLTLDGSRSGTSTVTGGATVTWSGVVHRVADDTVNRNFAGATETSRTHNGFATSHDTTAFDNGTVRRDHDEAASDSVVGITWNLPRLTNPFPVSGKFIRNVALHTTFTSATQTATRDLTKRIEVDFPADAQGNVTLLIDAKTCNLNLVTHAVTNCH